MTTLTSAKSMPMAKNMPFPTSVVLMIPSAWAPIARWVSIQELRPLNAANTAITTASGPKEGLLPRTRWSASAKSGSNA